VTPKLLYRTTALLAREWWNVALATSLPLLAPFRLHALSHTSSDYLQPYHSILKSIVYLTLCPHLFITYEVLVELLHFQHPELFLVLFPVTISN
jgi:hypothetical protein